MKLDIKETITVPEGLTATYVDGTLTIKGEKGEISRPLFNPQITFTLKGNTITLARKQSTKREKSIL